MTKQELLKKLATECATWEEVESRADQVSAIYVIGASSVPVCMFELNLVSNQDWLAERDRILNKPSWKDAPKGATHLAFNHFLAQWYWYTCKPFAINGGEWAILAADGDVIFASQAIAIPAGYNWAKSLEVRPQ